MTDSFRQFGLRPEVQRALDEVGYSHPTPIQRKSLPLILAGHDLVGVAQTGTGKTLAYLLPILQAFKEASAEISISVSLGAASAIGLLILHYMGWRASRDP